MKVRRGVQCLVGEVVGLVLFVANHLKRRFDTRNCPRADSIAGGGDDMLYQVFKEVVEDVSLGRKLNMSADCAEEY